MTRNVLKTKEPVVLEGFQSCFKEGKFPGYKLETVIDQELIDALEEERIELLKWCLSKVKNPKRAIAKLEPWEEVSDGQYKVKFSWNEKNKPPFVDTEGTPVTDPNTPLYSGSKVKVAFYQKPYVMQDGITYGTSLKLLGVQIISVNGQAGVDSGDLKSEEVAAIFGTTKGYKILEPNVVPKPDEDANEDDDF